MNIVNECGCVSIQASLRRQSAYATSVINVHIHLFRDDAIRNECDVQMNVDARTSLRDTVAALVSALSS